MALEQEGLDDEFYSTLNTIIIFMSMFLRNKPMAWTGLVVALSFWMNQGARGKGMLLNIGIATSALFINYIL